MNDVRRSALRASPGKLSFFGRVVLWTQVAVGFSVGFILSNIAAYVLSLLVQAKWGGGLMLTGVGLGVLAGLMGARNAYDRFGLESEDSHGSARFAYRSEVRADLAGDAGLIVGRELKGRKLLRYDGPAHLLTIAPTRSGKGVGTIVPNLLAADRSVLCIDPKGENARVTARARARLGADHSTKACRSTSIANQPRTVSRGLLVRPLSI